MPLELYPIQESDFPELVRIQMAAFQAGGGITSLLVPDPLPSDYVQKSVEKHIKAIRSEPDVHYMKVIDTDLNGAMVACAKWRINERERTEEQMQRMLPVCGPDEEGKPAVQEFYQYLSRVRKEYMGTKPFYCSFFNIEIRNKKTNELIVLHLLVTDPKHHRRGAGAMLIAWGLGKADSARLPGFLEASPMGKPLYARMGFKPIHEEVFDLAKYGLQGTTTNTCMIREPLTHVV